MCSPTLRVKVDASELVLAASSCDHSRQNGAFWEKGERLLKATLLLVHAGKCGLMLFTGLN